MRTLTPFARASASVISCKFIMIASCDGTSVEYGCTATCLAVHSKKFCGQNIVPKMVAVLMQVTSATLLQYCYEALCMSMPLKIT